MFLRSNVANAATLALAFTSLGLAGSKAGSAMAQPGVYEAPVTIQAPDPAPVDQAAAPHAAVAASATAPSPVPAVDTDDTPEPRATSLAALVADQDVDQPLDDEADCLATAIFYEARSESLAGQLAVARVIINRAGSGRFPRSLCGVVTQPGQFSFVRGGHLPDIESPGLQWRNARAIARIALDNGWKSQAEGALFFHAARVSPGWGRQRMTQIDNHIFYR